MGLSLNENYKCLDKEYLFAKIADRVASYKAVHPKARFFRHDIGDVIGPLTPTVVEAMRLAVTEMGSADSFRGYPSYCGAEFLREAAAMYYRRYGVTVEAEDIFVSDGVKSDLGNFGEIFGDVTVLFSEPCYPAFLDGTVMCGRKIVTLKATKENDFLPLPTELPKEPYLIYLCSPANPTGAVYDRAGLKKWVDFALESGSVILFDAAYEAYAGEDMPHSIYEIEGAASVAVELTSLSKSAGFTGVRVSFAVVPRTLIVDGVCLRERWARRQSAKFNGISYISARGAQAALSKRGIAEWSVHIKRTLDNGKKLSDVLKKASVFHTCGRSPYVFMQCPKGMDPWVFFDRLLEKTGIVGTPGVGFGGGGEGYFRLSTFADCGETAGLLGDFLKHEL